MSVEILSLFWNDELTPINNSYNYTYIYIYIYISMSLIFDTLLDLNLTLKLVKIVDHAYCGRFIDMIIVRISLIGVI